MFCLFLVVRLYRVSFINKLNLNTSGMEKQSTPGWWRWCRFITPSCGWLIYRNIVIQNTKPFNRPRLQRLLYLFEWHHVSFLSVIVTFNLFPGIFFLILSQDWLRLINMPGHAPSRSGRLRQWAERVSIWRQVSEIVTRGSIKPREIRESGDVRMLRVLDQLASSPL